ncbi:MAG: helix-turn-helix domain-containing protein [Clostridia bacterium]|nr:helix-turn-helix domain-containing protein [Clostridia bacterium]
MKMVHREEHNEGFTIIDNAVLLNVNLSWEARGFFAYLLSLPDDWNFNVKGLAKQTGATEHTIKRLLRELQAEGYIKLTRHTDARGKVTRWSWDIYEAGKTPETVQMLKSPQVETATSGESHKVDEPDGGLTTCGKSDYIQSTNNNKVLIEQSTKSIKEKIDKREKHFVPPSVEEVRAYCLERNNQINPETFVDFYTAKGWMVGKNKMKDWKAAVRTWEKDRQPAPKAQTLPTSSNPFTELKRREGLI